MLGRPPYCAWLCPHLRKIRNRDAKVGSALIVQQAIKILSVVEAYADSSQVIEAAEDSELGFPNTPEEIPIPFFVFEANNALSGETK